MHSLVKKLPKKMTLNLNEIVGYKKRHLAFTIPKQNLINNK